MSKTENTERATLIQIKDFLEIGTEEFAKDWKLLDEKEREFFRTEIGKVINHN